MTSKLPPLISIVMQAIKAKQSIEETTLAELLILELAGEPVFLALENIGKGIAFQSYRKYMVDTATQLQLLYNNNKSKEINQQLEAIKTTPTWRYKKVAQVATMYPVDVATGASKSFVANLLKVVSGEVVPSSDKVKPLSLPEIPTLKKKQIPDDSVRLTSLADEAFDENGVFIGGTGYRYVESPIGYFFQLLNQQHTALLWKEFAGKGE